MKIGSANQEVCRNWGFEKFGCHFTCRGTVWKTTYERCGIPVLKITWIYYYGKPRVLLISISNFVSSQITDLEQQNRKLETQAMSVQHRLANLQVSCKKPAFHKLSWQCNIFKKPDHLCILFVQLAAPRNHRFPLFILLLEKEWVFTEESQARWKADWKTKKYQAPFTWERRCICSNYNI